MKTPPKNDFNTTNVSVMMKGISDKRAKITSPK
jgi:hypothetical protein